MLNQPLGGWHTQKDGTITSIEKMMDYHHRFKDWTEMELLWLCARQLMHREKHVISYRVQMFESSEKHVISCNLIFAHNKVLTN